MRRTCRHGGDKPRERERTLIHQNWNGAVGHAAVAELSRLVVSPGQQIEGEGQSQTMALASGDSGDAIQIDGDRQENAATTLPVANLARLVGSPGNHVAL